MESRFSRNAILSNIIFLSLVFSVPGTADGAIGVDRARVTEAYSRLPLSFEPNQGQTDERVRFLARGPGYTLFLTRREAVLSLAAAKNHAMLRVKVGNASGSPEPVGVDALGGKSHYFIGNDPRGWRTDVPQFRAVKYPEVYTGIDLVYHGNGKQLEYDFVVRPEANPDAIELRFEGANKLRVNKDGDLVVKVGPNELVEHTPVAYQEIGGKRQKVAAEYVLRGRSRVGFRLMAYDHGRELIIDPTLVYSTFLGPAGEIVGQPIAVDGARNVYITGGAGSTDFPTTPGAWQPSDPSGEGLAFVSKLNAAGSALLYSTYLGGNYSVAVSTMGIGIAVDSYGHAYVTGRTTSPAFPTTPGAFLTHQTAKNTCFVTKLNASGSSLLYSSYLGGSGDNYVTGIQVNSSGQAFVTGSTTSLDFPVTPGAFQTTYNNSDFESSDAFITKLNAKGSGLIYSTYLSGNDLRSRRTYTNAIAVDNEGAAYVTGLTNSLTFPTTPGSLQSTFPGDPNINFATTFVFKLNPTGSAPVYSTFLGGTGPGCTRSCPGFVDQGYGIAVDASGSAYIVGQAFSADFPTTPAAFQSTLSQPSISAAFVSKLNPAGSALLLSTLVGGAYPTPPFIAGQGGDVAYAVAVDNAGRVFLAGQTQSCSFPVTPNAFMPQSAHCDPEVAYDAFFTVVNKTGTALDYSTYLSGTDSDVALGVALDRLDQAYVAGQTSSTDYPTTPHAFQTTNPLKFAAFITKFNLRKNAPVISLDSILPGPPKQVLLSSIDSESGLSTIQVLRCDNCTAVTDSFSPGTKDRVITTATKTDQTQSSSVQIQATNMMGDSTIFDPVDITIQGNGGTERKDVTLSSSEHLLEITNGKPGVRKLLLLVKNRFIPLELENGEMRTVDLGSALGQGEPNPVAILFSGEPGATASLLFTEP